MSDLSEEAVQDLLKLIVESSQQTSQGYYRLPTGLLEGLGLAPRNADDGEKANNFREEESTDDSKQKQPRKFETKRLSFHKEKARALASKAEYFEACRVLEDITSESDSTDLGTKLLMTECYLQLGRENRANKYLRQVRDVLKTDPLLPASDLVSMADDFLTDSSYVRAMIVVNIAAEIYLSDTSLPPDDILSGVYQCCNKLDDIVRPMLLGGGRNRTVAADMGMEILVDLFEKLGEIKNCNRSIQVVKEAQCCRFIGHKFSILDDVRKAMKFAKISVAKMEEQFGPIGARRYNIYGGQLHNWAIALGNLQKFDEAMAVYQKAIEANENAEDFPDEMIKRAIIEKAKRDRKQLKSMMG